MSVHLLTSAEDLARHDAWVTAHPHGTLWQSAAWRRYQAAAGRQTLTYAVQHGDAIAAAALVIVDSTTGGFSTWECPRGPLWTMGDELRAASMMETIIADAKRDRCLQLFLSPPISLAAQSSKLVASGRHVNPEATIFIDLSVPEEAILAQMHQKGRYNIKVAEKQAVQVATSSDISAFYDLLASTGRRDGFIIHQKSHYARFLESLDSSVLLLATHAGRPVAGLLGVTWNTTGIYYYGASAYEQRALMAPYLLQWAAMRYCKARGCTRYDLLGIDPPAGPPTTWKGVTEFKYKFGGTPVLYPPEQQLVLRPWATKALALKRKIMG